MPLIPITTYTTTPADAPFDRLVNTDHVIEVTPTKDNGSIIALRYGQTVNLVTVRESPRRLLELDRQSRNA